MRSGVKTMLSSWKDRLNTRRGALLVFLVLLGAMSAVFSYPEVLFQRPDGHHLWRQSDCLSLAQGYMAPESRFLEGTMHYLGADGSGQSMSDLPVIYWSVGRIWRFTGREEAVYRALVLLFFYMGITALFLTMREMLADGLLAALLTLLLFSSPMVAYYANNFLMNMPALGLVLMGWWAVAVHLRNGRHGPLLLALSLFTLAGALKASASLSLIAVLTIGAIHFTPLRGALLGELRVPHPRTLVLGAFTGILLITLWFSYTRTYNAEHDSGVFLVGLLPIWELDGQGIGLVMEGIREHFKNAFFRPILYPFLALALIAVISGWRKVPRAMLTLFVLLVVGGSMVDLFFFQALQDHDYYLLDQMFLPMFLLALGAGVALRRWPALQGSTWVYLVLLVLLVHCTDHTRRRLIDRHTGWQQRASDVQFDALDRIGPYLSTIGVNDDARVIVFPDKSFNVALYRMDRKGWSDFGGLSKRPDDIRRCMDLGARYLLTCNDELLDRPVLRPFLQEPVGHFENVRIFRLR